MDAPMGGQIDPLDRRARPTHETLGEHPLARGKREHRATVVRIAMQIQEPRGCKPPLDRLERRTITPLAHVRNSHQQGRLGHFAEG
jgi:hypothetical protein